MKATFTIQLLDDLLSHGYMVRLLCEDGEVFVHLTHDDLPDNIDVSAENLPDAIFAAHIRTVADKLHRTGNPATD